MLAVSEAYLEAIQSDTVVTDWHGTIKAKNGVVYEITPSAIANNSLKITRQICQNDKDLQIGTTCSAELDVSLYLENVSRYELFDASISLSFFLELEHNVWEEVPVGKFTVNEPPERNVSIISLHAYDNMMKFNKDFGATLQGSPYDILSFLCSGCGVEFGNTQEEISNFVNGDVETYNFADVRVYTYRDAIGHMATYLCCFAYIGVDGKLYLKPYGMEADRTFTENQRYEYKPKDYEAYYTSLSSYFAVTQEYESVILSDGGLDYDIGANPFIQFNADDVRRSVLTNIITKLATVSYTPFSGKFWCDPSIMPGDVLNFTGNHAVDGKLAAVTKQVIKMNAHMELSCGGSDPNLNVLTATEKRIQTAAKNSNKDGMYYYDYVNPAEIRIRDGKTARIILFNYTTTKQTHVDFHGEVKGYVDTTEEYDEENDLYTENDGVLNITYRQGGDEVTEYYPVDTFFDGLHLLHLFFSWWASGNIISSFEVYLTAIGCDLIIAAGASRGTIEGVGLVGEVNWNGGVYIYDDFKPIDFSIIRKPFTGDLSTAMGTPDDGTLFDTVLRRNFFKTVAKRFTDRIVPFETERFSVPYNDDEMDKQNVIASAGVWANEDPAVDGTVTTPETAVPRILQAKSLHTSGNGDVTYIASFDAGETWWYWSDGWTLYESGYAMVESTMLAITDKQWKSQLIAHGKVMIRAILENDASLTDIQIITSNSEDWDSSSHLDVECDEYYTIKSRDRTELRYEYLYQSEEAEIDVGRMSKVDIDTTIYSEVNEIYAHARKTGI